MRATFAVGSVRGRVQRVLWLAPADARVFPGPWRVTAVVSGDALETASPTPAPSAGPSRQPGPPPGPAASDGGGQLTLL